MSHTLTAAERSDAPARQRLRRLQRALLGLSAVMFAGTILELILAEHTEEPIQVLPFVLCAAALGCVALVWQRNSRGAVRLLRVVMVVTALSSMLGVAEHFWGNHQFARETHPRASEWDLLRPSLQGGVPLLAPGILAAGGVLAIIASMAVEPGDDA